MSSESVLQLWLSVAHMAGRREPRWTTTAGHGGGHFLWTFPWGFNGADVGQKKSQSLKVPYHLLKDRDCWTAWKHLCFIFTFTSESSPFHHVFFLLFFLFKENM